jgi:RNA polymerase sigma factor (sigma-70 family)
MPSGSSSPLLRFIRKLAARGTDEPSDGELLAQFIGQRDESAFAALVRRHGAMVLGVCQSVLNDAHDAEDVFQAAFLVLVRNARRIGKPESVGSWLHGVAYRLAQKARAAAARRRTCERQAPTMPTTEPASDALWRDLRPVLHEEVNRLPQRYRAPFILCYLEGKTNEEAAALLGWPKGTVLSTLARARERLRKRLTGRGLALSSATLATVVTENAASAAVSGALIDSTVQAAALLTAGPAAAAGGISATVLAYTDGMMQTLFLARVKVVVVLALVTGAAVAGTGLALHRPQMVETAEVLPQGPRPSPAADPTKPAVPATKPAPEPDEKRLRGKWIVTAAEQHGAALDPLKNTRLEFTGDDFTLTAPRGEPPWIFRRGVTKGTFKLDAAAKPRALDLVDKDRTLKVIYLLEGDTLTLCVGDPDVRDRPPEFASKGDDRRLVLILRRD